MLDKDLYQFKNISQLIKIVLVLLLFNTITFTCAFELDHNCTYCYFKSPGCNDPYKPNDCLTKQCVNSECKNKMKSVDCCKNIKSKFECENSFGCKYDLIKKDCSDIFSQNELEKCSVDRGHCDSFCFKIIFIFLILFCGCFISYLIYVLFYQKKNDEQNW